MAEDFTIGILLSGTGTSKTQRPTPFGGKTQEAMLPHLLRVAEENDATILPVYARHYDVETGAFGMAVDLSDPDPEKMSRMPGEYRPNVILDKSPYLSRFHPVRLEIAKRYRFVNDPWFTIGVGSKLAPAMLFPEYAVPAKLVWAPEQLPSALDALSGDKVVAKPMEGLEGRSVGIHAREDILAFGAEDIPDGGLILQEFLDTSSGVPGVVEGTHDIRLVFLGDRVSYAAVRTPPEGSLLANVSLGGSKRVLDPSEVPSALEPVIRSINERFSAFPHRFFTADFLFDASGTPKMLEMNYTPGFSFVEEDATIRDRFFAELISLLRDASAS